MLRQAAADDVKVAKKSLLTAKQLITNAQSDRSYCLAKLIHFNR